MESATILTPPGTGLSSILLSSEPNISEGLQYEKYQHYIDVWCDCVSDTLMCFLFKLSSKLNCIPKAYFILHIVTNELSNYPPPLQIALGLLMRNSNDLVGNLSELGVSCSYAELQRLKKISTAAATSPILQGISDSDPGLIQVVVDNFDAYFSLQNGKSSRHSLAVLVTQSSSSYQSEYPDNK